jgi:hypothetical protein
MIRDKEMELYKLGLERDDLRKTLSKKESLLTSILKNFKHRYSRGLLTNDCSAGRKFYV